MLSILTSPSILTILAFIAFFAFLNFIDKGRMD